MSELKDFSKCTKCDGVIIADTEDWNDPLCADHYFMFIEEENKTLKAQLAIAVEGLEFYSNIAQDDNHQFIFADETDSRAEVYERYKDCSIGNLGVKAHDTLQKIKLRPKAVVEGYLDYSFPSEWHGNANTFTLYKKPDDTHKGTLIVWEDE